MIYIMAALLFPGFCFPKSKFCFYTESMALAAVLGGFNGDLDLNNYRHRYELELIPFEFEQLMYSGVSSFFHRIGVSFEWYHFILTAITVFIIAICVRSLTEHYAYAMSLISTFALLETAWQLKTLTAMGMSVLALWWHYQKIYVPDNPGAMHKAVFLMLVLAAAQFHYLALFFVLFLFVKKKNHVFVMIKNMLLFDLIFFCFSDVVIKAAAKFLYSLHRYTQPMSIPSIMITIAWQVSAIAVVYCAQRYHKDEFSGWILQGTLLFLLLIPMYKYTVVATRIFRIWMIFTAIYISKLHRQGMRVSLYRILYDAYNFGSLGYWFVFINVYNGTESSVKYLLTNHILNG